MGCQDQASSPVGLQGPQFDQPFSAENCPVALDIKGHCHGDIETEVNLGYEVVELVDNWLIVSGREVFGGSVECPPGKKPLGGGGAVTDPSREIGQTGDTEYPMQWSRPHFTSTATPEPDGWEVGWQYPGRSD